MSVDLVKDVDPKQVTGVRAGNALWPGLLAFTGVSFFAYLLVKLASGAVAPDLGTFVQIGVSAAALAFGGWALVRARYFYVTLEIGDRRRKIAGLTKAEQTEIVARFDSDTAS